MRARPALSWCSTLSSAAEQLAAAGYTSARGRTSCTSVSAAHCSIAKRRFAEITRQRARHVSHLANARTKVRQ